MCETVAQSSMTAGFGINIDQPLLHSAISGDNAADGGSGPKLKLGHVDTHQRQHLQRRKP